MIKDISKNISEDVIHIAALEMIFLITAARSAGTIGPPESAARPAEPGARIAVSCAGSCRLIKRCMPELVIHLSLLFIAKDIICLCYFFKFLLCLRIPRICIRVIFLCKLSVCFLDLRFICISADAQHIIIISLY